MRPMIRYVVFSWPNIDDSKFSLGTGTGVLDDGTTLEAFYDRSPP